MLPTKEEYMEIEALAFIVKTKDGDILLEDLKESHFSNEDFKRFFVLIKKIGVPQYSQVQYDEGLQHAFLMIEQSIPTLEMDMIKEDLEKYKIYRQFLSYLKEETEYLRCCAGEIPKEKVEKSFNDLAEILIDSSEKINFLAKDFTLKDLLEDKCIEDMYLSAFQPLTYMPGALYVVGARPGHGKTTLMLNMALNLMTKCAVFSYEMPINALVEKCIRIKGNFLASDIDNRPIEFNKCFDELKDSDNMRFVEASTLIFSRLIANIRFLHRKEARDIFFIDYIGIIPPEKKYDSIRLQFAEYTRRLKLLAKELKICIILLAQLNRDIDKSGRKVPCLSDLKESGSLEADADVVFLLYSPSTVDENENQCDLIVSVAKNRFGKVGNVKLDYNKQTGVIADGYKSIYET